MKTSQIKSFSYRFCIICIFFVGSIFGQDVDIVPYLKQIESGQIVEVREALTRLKKENPQSPSVMFLDGVLTENGQEAIIKYQYILDNFPDSKYADAALYRIYSYYYALGLYETANEKLIKLTNDYPESPYIQIAKQNKLPVDESLSDNKKDESRQTDNTNSEMKNNTKYKYTIQAGAFSNMDNAIFLKNNFDQSGIFSEIREKSVGGTTFHVVYAGKFITQEEAENFLAIVNSRFELTGIVVPITWN